MSLLGTVSLFLLLYLAYRFTALLNTLAMEKTAKKSMFWLFTWVFIFATLWNSLALIWWN
ncbi:hypothetical protein [Neobacillus sp.]|uniref:hypothetical protein n=1 Tax=Neobacillus sp. TaxID=2675273 RepID=UPI0035B50EAA